MHPIIVSNRNTSNVTISMMYVFHLQYLGSGYDSNMTCIASIIILTRFREKACFFQDFKFLDILIVIMIIVQINTHN